MPSAGKATLVDTSVAIPALVDGHPDHAAALDALARRRVGLAGHAWFETYSVLTRLQPPLRLAPSATAALLHRAFPATRWLDAAAQQAAAAAFAEASIAGGAVYDGLVGWCARSAGLALLTRDRRALPTYQTLGVDTVWVG
jgi:predicted nucleic acid-binding protein